MNEGYAELKTRVRRWFDEAERDGWLPESAREELREADEPSPGDLFGQEARPMVVALFGGTGVGKSSLLNRLAGGALARTGVQRPTSHEVTLYLHESIPLERLPEGAPAERVIVRRHSIATRRDVVWIDCPDFDSTSEENRRLAFAWLPYIDLLIYVVSPERYRDDEGWRLLRSRGRRHGWMFVMNHWDSGDQRQVEDFKRVLTGGGFENPLLLCTCCAPLAPALPSPDQFREIEANVTRLLEEHGARELDRLGQRARLQDLRAVLGGAAARLGDGHAWDALQRNWPERWKHTRDALRAGAEWPIRLAASGFASRESGWLLELARGALSKSDAATSPDAAPAKDTARTAAWLWDRWVMEKLVESADALEVELRRERITPGPVRARLEQVFAAAPSKGSRLIEDHLRSALASPGTALQRLGRRVTGFLLVAAPGMALLWVAHNVVFGYYRASVGQIAYPGLDFAVSSVMLLLVSFLTPLFLDRLLRPSLEAAARGALREGFGAAVEAVGVDVGAALRASREAAAARRAEAEALMGELAHAALRPIAADAPTLHRLIASPAARQAAPA